MTLPLQGYRVLDLGIITAGAATGAMLADLGAEVVKVESPTYRDPFRVWNAAAAGSDDGFRPFRFTNRNKEGISIDLKTEEGRNVFLDLVSESDIVVENFRRGVLEELGIAYDVLARVRPGIILASVSSQGDFGPKAQYVSFGSTLEAMGGQAWQTGYDDGSGPITTGRVLNYPDQVVALFATGMILAACLHADETGRGAHLDLSQRELTSFLVGEEFARPADAPSRVGNADSSYAIQQCFKTTDGWVAVSIVFHELEQVVTKMARTSSRDNHEQLSATAGSDDAVAERLVEYLAGWCASRPSRDAASLLQAQGIAAAPVLDGPAVLSDRGNAWSEAIALLPSNTPVKGFPFSYTHTPLSIYRDAPEIGADTAAVLTRVAAYTPERIATLRVAGVIETRE